MKWTTKDGQVQYEWPDISIGDLVRLKSGGPTMTVDNVYKTTVDVAWFGDFDKLYKNTIAVGAIVKVEE